MSCCNILRSLLALAAACLWLNPATADIPRILVLGDSLSSAFNMPLERGWVSLLQDRLETEGYEYRVVNASVSGDTTASALTRLPRALQRHRPAVVIVELGGNDGLRGLPVSTVSNNLDRIIASSRAAGAAVLLTGIRIPPNYGPNYTEQFEAIYTTLGEAYGIPVVPFLLDGIALDPDLMQADGIHPNAAAQERLLDNVWPLLAPLLAP